MKKIGLIIALIISTIAFAQKNKNNSKGYQIDVKLKNSTDSACYLAYYFGKKKYIKDTAVVVKNNHFSFRGNKPLDGGIYIVYFPDKTNFEILVKEQEFTIELDKNKLMEGISFKGSEENTLFYNYLNLANNTSKEVSEDHHPKPRNCPLCGGYKADNITHNA